VTLVFACSVVEIAEGATGAMLVAPRVLERMAESGAAPEYVVDYPPSEAGTKRGARERHVHRRPGAARFDAGAQERALTLRHFGVSFMTLPANESVQ
jgi:hypothetical protein